MPPKKPTRSQQNQKRARSSARRKAARPRKPADHDFELKRAEAALSASEQRFRAIYDQTYEFIGLLNPDGMVLDANHTALAFRGLHLPDVVGKPFWETPWWDVSPDLQAKLKTGIAQAAQGHFTRLNAQHRGQDGTVEEIDFSLTPITDANGKVTQIIPEGRRITALTRVQDQLRQAQADLERRVRERTADLERVNEELHALQVRQQLLLTATPVVLYARRATGDYGATFVSENVVDQLGYRAQDYTDHSDFWVSHIHPDDRPWVLAGLSQVFEEGQHVHEYRFSHQDGTYRWLHDELRLIRDQAGTPVELVGFQINVTKRKDAEEAVRRTEAFTASVVDNLPNMLFVKDAKDLRFVRVNKAAERLLGYSERELLGKNDHDVFPEEEADFFTAKDQEVLAHGQLLEIPEEPIRTRNGETRLLHTKKIPLFDPAGHPQYLLGISEDITYRKRVEEALHEKQVALERSQAQLQNLATKLITAQEEERRGIARDLHDDITQRLAALTIDLGNLRVHESDSNESTSEDIERLRERAKQLTIDVQRLSHELHPTVLDHLGLEEAVREHVEEFADRTGLATQVVTRRLPPTISLKHATCLYRVLQESLQNVRKHANATSVLVRLLNTPQGVGLCVHDDGRGFEHAQETKRSNGLGLSSMAERIRILQGTFRIRTKPGDGTEIHASIPLEVPEPSHEVGAGP